MRLGSKLIIAALVVGIFAAIMIVAVPGFKSWFFLVFLVAFGLLVAGVLVRAQPPK
jgi:hypothetical protein